MPRDLPSLNAVRMFEAAARHKNFTRAAEALHVTQGAVSRQIKRLEEDLGQALFLRDGPRLELTDAGRHLYAAAADAMSILRRTTHELQHAKAAPVLTISVLPSFAARWLVPRIAAFQSLHDRYDIRLAASYDPVDFAVHADIDIAIRFGCGEWDDVAHECLFREQLFPVASPGWIAEHQDLTTPAGLATTRRLLASSKYDQWSEWFKAAGIEPPAGQRGPRYSDASMLLRAAVEGQGVALARSLLVEDEITSGQLVRLCDVAIPSKYCYYLVYPPGRELDPRVATFIDWIRGEAAQNESACESCGLA